MKVLLNKLFDKHSEGYGVYDRKNLIKDICKEYQALQLQQTGVSSCCDMSVCMKLPKCSKQCKDCNSVQ